MGNDWGSTDSQAMNNDDIENNVEIFGDEVPDNNGPAVHIPAPFEPEWDDYVLSHFQPNEFFQNNPTVDGLRRVAEKLVGVIMQSNTQVVSAPSLQNPWVTVVVEIAFSTEEGLKRFSGAADASDNNVNPPYNKFLTAMAETRAEGRALRRALKLKVVAAEELINIPEQITPVVDKADLITVNQINFIDLICLKNNINVQKLVNKVYPNVNNINMLMHTESLEIQKILSSYQRSINTIPVELIGYEADWKSTFCN